MEAISRRSNEALAGLATMLCELYAAGFALPTAGKTVDLLSRMNARGVPNTTFTIATLGLDTAGTYSYTLAFNYTDSSSITHSIRIELKHTPGSSSDNHNGLLTYLIGNKFNGGNCPGPDPKDVTTIGTLKYTRNGPTSIAVKHRQGQYCGIVTSSGTKVELNATASDYLELLPAPTAVADRWADSFSRFGAVYDPTTLAGRYVYAWQAGYNDSHARVMQMRLNSVPSDGEGYFGYGHPIQATTAAILGMICNWAGPGNVHTPTATEYAQRQFIRWNTTTEVWDVPTGDSDIRYAPTNSCLYNGSGTFWYDRNLSGGTIAPDDETANDINVTSGVSPATDLDLMGRTIGTTTYADIQTAISTGRGYGTPPAF